MHLFSKENIWSNPQQFPAYIQTKYNNSVNRIISKEEEREDPRRDTSVFFEYSGDSTYNPFYKIFFEYSVFYSVSTRNPATPRYFYIQNLILPQEILQLQGSSHADHYKASSSDCSPCIQAFYMAEQGSRLPYSIPGPHGTSSLPVNSTQQNSIPSGSQHPRAAPTAIPRHSTQGSTWYYRILPGEIGFIPKGSSIVYLCNTKVSVFQFTY